MKPASKIGLSVMGVLVAAVTGHAAATLSARVNASGYTFDGGSDYVSAPAIGHSAVDVVPANGQSQVGFAVEQTGATYPISGENLVVFARTGATAGLGDLHVYVNSEGHSDNTHYYYYGTAHADATAEFRDTITITPSAAHPAGSWVTLQAKLTVDKLIGYGPGALVAMHAQLEAYGPRGDDAQDDSGNPFGLNNSLYNSFLANNDVVENNKAQEELPGQFKVGSTYSIHGYLNAQITIDVGNASAGYFRDSGGFVDALDTSHSYFWSEDPTVVIATASGASYAVPEPTSLAAMILGGVVLLRRRR
jgi:hypothetical protein